MPRWFAPAGHFHIGGNQQLLLDNSLLLQTFFKSLQFFLLNLLRNLILHLLERRRGNIADIVQPDDVPAELHFHRLVGHLTLLQLLSRCAKLRHIRLCGLDQSRSPPFLPDPGSFEYCFARSSKLAPALIFAIKSLA